MIFFCQSDVQDSLVIASGPLGLRDDGVERVGEILEQPVLELDLHAENPVQELGHVVVALVQNELAGVVLVLGD